MCLQRKESITGPGLDKEGVNNIKALNYSTEQLTALPRTSVMWYKKWALNKKLIKYITEPIGWRSGGWEKKLSQLL